MVMLTRPGIGSRSSDRPRLRTHIERNGVNTTLVDSPGQAALRGALNRILALGFELLELARTADNSG
jgi:hypothetical protein